VWNPTGSASQWLLKDLFQRLEDQRLERRVLLHSTPKGNVIWLEGKPRIIPDWGFVVRRSPIVLDQFEPVATLSPTSSHS
jgi:hypothetical protein